MDAEQAEAREELRDEIINLLKSRPEVDELILLSDVVARVCGRGDCPLLNDSLRRLNKAKKRRKGRK